jgi:hypothetical protein
VFPASESCASLGILLTIPLPIGGLSSLEDMKLSFQCFVSLLPVAARFGSHCYGSVYITGAGPLALFNSKNLFFSRLASPAVHAVTCFLGYDTGSIGSWAHGARSARLL